MSGPTSPQLSDQRLETVCERLDSVTAQVAALAEQVADLSARVAKLDNRGHRYYVIRRVPAGRDLESLLGIWHTDWATIESKLPAGRLFGSGIRVKGFSTEAEARGDYRDGGRTDSPVIHQ